MTSPSRIVSRLALGAALFAGCPAPPEAEAPPPAEAPAEGSAEGEAAKPPPAEIEGAPAHGAASRPAATRVHGLENVSGLAYADPDCDGRAPCVCRGAISHGHNALARIGVTVEHLTEGVRCVFGDFDGNGYADAAVLAAEWAPKGPAQPAVVLLYDVDGLRSTARLPKRMASLGRAEVGGRDVLVEPAAASKYHFALDEADAFSLVRGPAKEPGPQ